MVSKYSLQFVSIHLPLLSSSPHLKDRNGLYAEAQNVISLLTEEYTVLLQQAHLLFLLSILHLASSTKFCISQSNFGYSCDFLPSYLTQQLLFPSVLACSADYLFSSFLPCSFFICVTCLALYYHMRCQMLFTASMILSHWHLLVLEEML